MFGKQLSTNLLQQLLEWWFRTRNMIDGNEFITVLGGDQHRANGEFSTILGGLLAQADLYGQVAHAAGSFSKVGQAQHGLLLARNETTDGTPTQLFLDGVDDLLLLKDESAWVFRGLVAGLRVGGAGQAAGGWTLEGVIRKDTTEASTTLVGSAVTQIALEGGLTWGAPALAADTTNGGLTITVTGAAGDHVRWVALLDTVDVGSFVYV